jgi:hypothetical protein
MNHKHAALALAAAAAFLAAPSFAQTTVQSGTAATVNSGSSASVTTPGTDASVTVMPHTSSAVPSARLMPGGAMVPYSSTTTLGGPGANMSGSKTVTTRYWVNVPPDAQQRLDFRRWQRLAD